MLLETILISIILSMTCWAVHEASQEEQLLFPIVDQFRVLRHPLITGCPKCMPTLWIFPLCGYIELSTDINVLIMTPLIWLTASGFNSLIIKILDND